MKTILTTLSLVVAFSLLNSCNTFIGATRDVQSFGTGLENKAKGKTWEGQEITRPSLPVAY